jgi:hypothetical protein
VLSNFNIEHILTFPFKETEDQKNFLIGALVYFAGFIIPILPLIFVMGYIARIMRQVFNGETPHMPAIAFYITLVMYTAFAQAYKDGKDRLAQ